MNIRHLYFPLVACLIPLITSAQNITKSGIGIEVALSKYSWSSYGVKNLIFDDIGTISFTQQRNLSYSQDLAFFYLRQNRHHYVKYLVELMADQRTLTGKVVSGPVSALSRPVVEQNYAVRGGFKLGYQLYGKRAVHIFYFAGVQYAFAYLHHDYNPINNAVKALTHDKISESLFGTPYILVLNRAYNYPRTTLSTGFDFTLFNVFASVMYDFNTKKLDPFKSSKPDFLVQLTQIRLKIGYLIRSKYSSHGK